MKDLYVLFHVTLRQLYELYTFIIYTSVEETDLIKLKILNLLIYQFDIRSSIGLQSQTQLSDWAPKHCLPLSYGILYQKDFAFGLSALT